MSSPIQPVGPASSGQVPDQDQDEIPQYVKDGLESCRNTISDAIDQIKQSKDTNEPLPQNARDMLKDVMHQLDKLIPEIGNAQIQNSISDARQQIQIVVQNPEAQLDPSGQLTQAYITISEAT